MSPRRVVFSVASSVELNGLCETWLVRQRRDATWTGCTTHCVCVCVCVCVNEMAARTRPAAAAAGAAVQKLHSQLDGCLSGTERPRILCSQPVYNVALL